MAKIPFDIKFRPEIESGEYKVETRDGRPVRILCWDANQFYPICAQFRLCAGTLVARYFDCNGIFEGSGETENDYDLFLVPAEPELTEFEKCVKECMEYDPEVVSDGDLLEATKEYAKELLATARKELQPEKDLPRWKKCEDGNTDRLELEALCREAGSPIEIAFRANGYRIFLSDLEKLPKEE